MANERRKNQIYEAALELFSARGYHGTGMGDIARKINMGTSSLYNHVHGKQEILVNIVTNAMNLLLDTHAQAVNEADSPVEKMRASMRAHVLVHARNSVAARVVNAEIRSLEEPVRSQVLQMRRDYVQRWLRIVEEGVEQGVFHVADPAICCFGLIDMGIGVALWFDPEGKYSDEELAEMYADMAVAAVMGPIRD